MVISGFCCLVLRTKLIRHLQCLGPMTSLLNLPKIFIIETILFLTCLKMFCRSWKWWYLFIDSLSYLIYFAFIVCVCLEFLQIFCEVGRFIQLGEKLEWKWGNKLKLFSIHSVWDFSNTGFWLLLNMYNNMQKYNYIFLLNNNIRITWICFQMPPFRMYSGIYWYFYA